MAIDKVYAKQLKTYIKSCELQIEASKAGISHLKKDMVISKQQISNKKKSIRLNMSQIADAKKALKG